MTIYHPNRIQLPGSDAYAVSWFRKSGRPAFGAGGGGGSSPAIDNILDGYTWDVAYSCDSALLTSIPEAGGNTAYDLVSGGNNTLAQSTAAFVTDGGIGASREDLAFFGATAGNTNATWDWASDTWHMRLVVDTTGASHNDTVFRYLVSATRFMELRYISSSGGILQFTVRNDSSGGIYIFSAAGIGSTPMLYDVSFTPNGGGSGFAQASAYLNGTDLSVSEHSAAMTIQNGQDAMGVFSREGGTLPWDSAPVIFLGWRWDQALSLAAHQADHGALI